jgi:hypothetical protein
LPDFSLKGIKELEERMTEQSWGIRWNADIKYSPDLGCSHCGYNMPFTIKERSVNLVGFDSSGGPQKKDKPGIFIYQCPICNLFFYYHASDSTLEIIKRSCPRWPKSRRT